MLQWPIRASASPAVPWILWTCPLLQLSGPLQLQLVFKHTWPSPTRLHLLLGNPHSLRPDDDVLSLKSADSVSHWLVCWTYFDFWDEAHLTIIYHLNMFTNLISKYFVENFCMGVQRNLSVVSFLLCPYVLRLSVCLFWTDLEGSLYFMGRTQQRLCVSLGFSLRVNLWLQYNLNFIIWHKGKKENIVSTLNSRAYTLPFSFQIHPLTYMFLF